MFYNIRNKSTNVIEFSNKTVLDIARLSLGDTSNYEIEEVARIPIQSTLSEKEKEKLLLEFQKNLTLSQQNDISNGRKKIAWIAGVGYCLRVVGGNSSGNEIHVSIEHQKLKRIEGVERHIKKAIEKLESDIFYIVRSDIDISMGEFSEIIKNYIK